MPSKITGTCGKIKLLWSRILQEKCPNYQTATFEKITDEFFSFLHLAGILLRK